MKLKQILLFVLCTAIFACSSDSTDSNEEPSNNNILLKKTIETNSDGEIDITNYSYDGNRLKEVTYDDAFKSMYTYENNNLTQVDYYEDNELESTITIEYNAENKVASYVEYLYNVSATRRANKFVITNSSDSRISFDVYMGDFNTQTEVYSTDNIINYDSNLTSVDKKNYGLSYVYDNKNSLFKNVFAIDVLNLLSVTAEFADDIYGKINNVTKITDAVGDNYLSVDTFKYNYNDNNYPVTAEYKESFNGSINYESTIQYFYE